MASKITQQKPGRSNAKIYLYTAIFFLVLHLMLTSIFSYLIWSREWLVFWNLLSDSNWIEAQPVLSQLIGLSVWLFFYFIPLWLFYPLISYPLATGKEMWLKATSQIDSSSVSQPEKR